MSRFFENRIAFIAVVIIFAAGWAWSSGQGGAIPAGHMLLEPALTVAHGPTMPPDPWDGNLAMKHGPTMPPDPWDGNLAVKHGPTMPPDPWDGNLAVKHGPTMPPDPWDGNLAVG